MKFLWSALVSLALCACSTTHQAAPTEHEEAHKPLFAGHEMFRKKGPAPASDHSPQITQAPAKPVGHSAHAPTSDAPAFERGPVSSDKALGWLMNGNTRFVHNKLRNDGQSAKDRARLSHGQKPHTIVLSCSDSRVPPEVLFDQKLGEIYVIRTGGESLDQSALASIEYGIAHLGANLILVMGHDSCGAVKTALSTLNGGDAGSPALNHLVKDLHPHLRSFASVPVSEGALVEGWANTEGVAKDLVQRSQIVRDAVNGGGVKIQTALYHLGSGKVEFR